MENKVLAETLQKALDMEEKGHEFYKDRSENSINNVTKKAFGFLADNEILHIETIKEFSDALRNKGEFPSIDLSGKKEERKKEFSIFSKGISELKEKVKPDDDDKKAYEFAMELETSGYLYYEKMLKEAKDENLVKLLKFLIEEEKKHYEEIEKLYAYLSDSSNWYMYEEGSFPQG